MFQRWVFRSHGAKDTCHTTLCAVERSVECCFLKIIVILSVASLGWVSPGAETGCQPYFFPAKMTFLDFLVITVSSSTVSPLFIFKKNWRPFLLVTFIQFTHVSAAPFLPVRPPLSTILCKFAPPQKKILFLLVLPPGGCHLGRSALTTLHRPPPPLWCHWIL